ncbi:MAG: hypothetical protein N2515_06355, partial [Deltaproteobacteria bacterium]|nr:hypothetical protein [Deltaproteobacteria bacterium]
MALAWKHPSWEAWLNLLGYAIGSFRRRIGRNLALILGIASAVGWWGSVVLVSEGLRVLQDKALKEGPDLWVIQLQGGRPALIDLRWVNRLEGLLGVRRVRARVWGYLVVPALEANLVVWGEEEMSPEEADVGPGLARHLGLRPGDRLALDSAFSRAVFKVRHILSPQTSLWAHDAVIVSLEQARRLLGIPEGMASDLAIEVFPPEEIPALAREIASQVPGGRVTSREDMAHLYALTLSGRVGVLGALFGPVIIALFLLAWERLSGLSLEERAEIGVLKAIGWPTAIVLQV